MSTFSYTVRPHGGKIQSGKIEAETLGEASKKLHAEGFSILKLTEEHGLPFSLKNFTKKVPFKDKIIFTRELSVMTKAGLPIVKAMEALAKQTESQYFKEVIRDIIVQIKGGRTLSKALAKYPKVFPEIYIAVVKAGEQTGQLAEVLMNLAEQQEKDADLISKVKSAMIYPAVILLALVGVVILIVFFVLPNLTTVFADSNTTLPFATRLLLGVSDVIRHYFLIVIALLAGAYIGFRYWVAKPSGRAFYDKLKIKIPVFGTLTKKVYMARFSRTMAMLTKASLPILVSIKIIRKTINNYHYDLAFDRIEKAVESGKALSAALEKEVLFPPMVSQLTSLGEESGSLEGVFVEIADFYDKEVDTNSKNLSTLLEPVMLIIMGIGVAFVAIAVLQPIYGLVQNFGG